MLLVYIEMLDKSISFNCFYSRTARNVVRQIVYAAYLLKTVIVQIAIVNRFY